MSRMRKHKSFQLVCVSFLMIVASISMAEEPGPAMIELSQSAAGDVAALELYQIPASYWPELQDARQLPKTMFSWATDLAVLRNPQNFEPLKHYARITGSLGVGDKGWGYNDADMLLADTIVKSAAMLRSDKACGLTLNTFPYQRVAGCGELNDWADIGKEIAYLSNLFGWCKSLGINVNCISYDMECYTVQSDAVTALADEAYRLAKFFYGHVPIRWYRNGDWPALLHALHDDNQGFAQYRTYSAPWTEGWLDRWERNLPHKYDVPLAGTWTTWPSLGPGYNQDDQLWHWKSDPPLHDKEYEYLGRIHMADERIKDMVVFPSPFRPICAPESIEAFLAYVRGATQ